MSMSATFVQVDEAELSRLEADPESAELLFHNGPLIPPAFGALAKTLQDRVRAGRPMMTAEAFSRLDPQIRKQVEASLGRLTAAFGSGARGDEILKIDGAARPRSLQAGVGPDAEWVMDAFRRLRDFYAGAAAKGRAIGTCLV